MRDKRHGEIKRDTMRHRDRVRDNRSRNTGRTRQMNGMVGAEEGTNRYRDKNRDNKLRTSCFYEHFHFQGFGGVLLLSLVVVVVLACHSCRCCCCSLNRESFKKRADAAEEYALRVIPAETRLTVYRRLRVLKDFRKPVSIQNHVFRCLGDP